MVSFKKRMSFFLAGIFILTLGVSLTITANFGTGGWDAVNVKLSEWSDFSVGTFMVIVAMIMLLLCGLLRKGKFNGYTLLTAICLGGCVDLWLLLLKVVIKEPSVSVRVFTFIIGIVLTAIGVSVYLFPKLAPNPIDDFVVSISEVTPLTLGHSKLIVDITGIIVAFLIGAPIGFGTVVIVLAIGPLVGMVTNQITKWGWYQDEKKTKLAYEIKY